MFTGLIEELGTVRRISSSGEGTDIVIAAKKVLSDLKIGDSIAVNGPCLTATAVDKNNFTAWAMPETLEKTNLRQLTTGSPVNLERAMTLNGRLGGHLVSGHIDAVITLAGREPQGGAIILTFAAPEELMRYIIPKGSVSLDGVSLTVIDVDENRFSVGLIPHTAGETTLGRKESGAPVNLEVDLIGKYVEKMLTPHQSGEQGNKSKSNLTMSMLMEKGYL